MRGSSKAIADALISKGVSIEEFMTMSPAMLMRSLSSANIPLIRTVSREEAMLRAIEEQKFIDGNGIRFIFCHDADYPPLLAECNDAPAALFVLGHVALTHPRSLAVVGTRKATRLGVAFASRIAGESRGVCIVSGLAYGIDAAAHNGALEKGNPTIAVLAHGLDTMYPSQHRALAREIVKRGGGLITQYPSGVKPFRPNFLERNRIVAGLSHGTLVVESEIKGGAMSTANHAFSYNREVMAMPGRINDATSSGCNLLIRSQKASLVTGVADIFQTMGWDMLPNAPQVVSPSLFANLDEPQGSICNLLSKPDVDSLSLDEISLTLAIPAGKLLAILQEMEFDGLVERLPGNRYCAML